MRHFWCLSKFLHASNMVILDKIVSVTNCEGAWHFFEAQV